jgi:hypothetical protein
MARSTVENPIQIEFVGMASVSTAPYAGASAEAFEDLPCREEIVLRNAERAPEIREHSWTAPPMCSAVGGAPGDGCRQALRIAVAEERSTAG